MTLERIPGPEGFSLSDGVVVSGSGRWIYVSGQIARNLDGIEEDLGAQADACFDQIDGILQSSGAGLADVVRITAYVTRVEDYAAFNRVRKERFRDSLPASAAVQVAGLLTPGAQIEIDAVAFVGG